MKRSAKFGAVFVTSLLVLGTIINPQNTYAAVPGINTLVSVNSTGDGQGGNNNSAVVSARSPISSDGRYVAFSSTASNLVPNDTNGYGDVFVRDLANNTTTLVSVSTTGVQGNNESGTVLGSGVQDAVAISGNGRYVVFKSQATNMIDGQTIQYQQTYIRDRVLNTTKLVTKKADGTPNNGGSIPYAVSDDGRFVLFTVGTQTILVPHVNNTYGSYILRADLKDQSFEYIHGGDQLNQLQHIDDATMSCDGTIIALSGTQRITASDTDSTYDVYLFDLRNGFDVTSVTGGISNDGHYSMSPRISCNGNYVTFQSNDTALDSLAGSSALVFTYLYDRIESTISIVDTSTNGTLANNASDFSAVDDEGNVIFSSYATNLIDGSTTTNKQVFLKNRKTGNTDVLSKTAAGAPSNGVQGSVAISANGALGTYGVGSNPTNLITSDTNGKYDVIASKTGL